MSATTHNVAETTYVDHNGDLEIKVGQPPVEHVFVVDSRSLARASKVWDKMFFGPWKDSQPQGPESVWRVEFPEDDVAAMNLMLNIVHGCFSAVPPQLSLDELFSLTVLSDKYGLKKQLEPWANHWISPFRAQISKSSEENEMKLWIARELGDEDMFLSIGQAFLMHSELSPEGNLLLPPSSSVSSLTPTLTGFLEAIQSIRAVSIEQLYQIPKSPLEDWRQDCTKSFCQIRELEHEQRQCHCMILGLLVTSLQQFGPQPGAPGDDCRGESVQAISDRIKDTINFPMLGDDRTTSGYRKYKMSRASHQACLSALNARPKMASVLKDLKASFEKALRVHFPAQKEKSGIVFLKLKPDEKHQVPSSSVWPLEVEEEPAEEPVVEW